jgi:integrase/recombinase XerD
MKTTLRSHWANELEEFLQFRQTNFTSSWPRQKIQLFDRFAAQHPKLSLPEAIAAWLKRDPSRNPRTIGHDLTAVRQFCLYRRRFDPSGSVPFLVGPAPSARMYFKATILSIDQVGLLLKRIVHLQGPPLRRARVRALFLVLYCTGLRLGEAIRLNLADVDLSRAYFRIGPSKGRARWVPLGQDLARELKAWLDQRRRAGFIVTPQTPLFQREDGQRDSQWNASMRLNTLFEVVPGKLDRSDR